jgi:hypothetical protein
MYYQALENVLSPAQVNPPHSAAVIQVFIPAFQHLAASAQQPLSPLPSNPTAIRIYRLPLAILSFPALPSALWLGAIGTNMRVGQIAHHLPAVIALVGDHFARTFRIYALAVVFAVCFCRRIRDPLARFGNRLHNRGRVAFIGSLNRYGHNRTRLHVHGVLGLRARCVRPSFIFVMRASASCGCRHSSLDPFFQAGCDCFVFEACAKFWSSAHP